MASSSRESTARRATAPKLRITRLTSRQPKLARQLFAMMAHVFEEAPGRLGEAYVRRVLGRAEFWALAAIEGHEVVGGITAHALPMTRAQSSELFIYDVAVRADHQRQGVGRRLMQALRKGARAAGITELFVAADNEDAHALDFYRALGGSPAAVTIFSYSRRRPKSRSSIKNRLMKSR
jgi:aminoglycoside 3-N-acetyltransferase I